MLILIGGTGKMGILNEIKNTIDTVKRIYKLFFCKPISQEEKVYNYMKKHGGITSMEMFENFYICCPHAVIRNLRQKYDISDAWQEIEKIYYYKQGRKKYQKRKLIRYKKYFLAA